MDPLSVTASVIAILQLTGKVIKYLHDVKDAPKECQQCAIEASNLLSLLTNLRYRLEQARNDDPWYRAARALNVENGPLDQYKQALEQLQSRVETQNGLQKVKKRLLWKFSKAELANILARMERLKSLVDISLEMDHFKLSQAIKDDIVVVKHALNAVQGDVATVRDTQSLQWDAQKLQQHQAVMQWLSPSDFAAQQHDIISRKEEGTGQWFLGSPEFKAWQQGPEKTLFCPGIPGAGKTMIAAIAIDHLCKRSRSEDIGVAYLFCNYKAQQEQNSAALLAVVLKQLTQSRPDMTSTVAQMYENHQKHKTRPSVDEILGALQPVCLGYLAVYLVTDALDECTDRDGARTKLIDKLCKLQAKTNVRLMFTSRYIPEIEEKFESDPLLEVRASDHDVRRYVAGQLFRLPKCIQRNSELIQDVQDKIAEAVEGMFLLARLHVDSLLDKKTIKEAKATLQAFKRGAQSLDAAYGEALERIEGQLAGDTLLAKQALSWITYAQRPLTIQELCHALAIKPGERVLDPDAICDIDDILSTCAGLVTVDTESNVVRLVHYTTQKYLEGIRLDWIPNAQLDIATACITYLSMDTFLSGSCDSDKAFEARLRDNVFLEYSAQHWGRHVEVVQQSISGLALAFLCSDGLVLTAIQATVVGKYRYGGYSQRFPRQTSGLHLVARYGLTHLAEMLLEKPGYGLRVEAKDNGWGRTPLSWAAANGHEAVVRLLVERDDVEADAKDKDGRTPLSWAAANGHEAVVRLLKPIVATELVQVQVRGGNPPSPPTT